MGKSELVDLLLKSGASLSVVDNKVIKPSVKLRQSNIKLSTWRVILFLKQKMLSFITLQKKWFDGSHLLFEQTDLLHGMVKVSSVSCCVLF